MTNIKSNHDGPLALPGGLVIPAGATIAVPNWESIKGHRHVDGWLAAKVIEEAGNSPKPAKEEAPSVEKPSTKGAS